MRYCSVRARYVISLFHFFSNATDGRSRLDKKKHMVSLIYYSFAIDMNLCVFAKRYLPTQTQTPHSMVGM